MANGVLRIARCKPFAASEQRVTNRHTLHAIRHTRTADPKPQPRIADREPPIASLGRFRLGHIHQSAAASAP